MNQSSPENTDEELLEELRRVGSDLGFRVRARKAFWIIFGFIAFDLLVSGLAVFALIRVVEVQHSSCKANNEFRQAYVDQWTPIIAESPPPVKPPADSPQEVLDAYAVQVKTRKIFIDGLNNNFAQHPC